MHNINVQLGKLLKEKREERGLTTTYLAYKVGVSEDHYKRIEKGLRGFSFGVLVKILAVLNVRLVSKLNKEG